MATGRAVSLAQPSLDVNLVPGGGGDSRALPHAGLGLLFMRTVGIWDLKPDSLCVPSFAPHLTTFPALDGLHPAVLLGKARLKPLVTVAHRSDASATSAGSYL